MKRDQDEAALRVQAQQAALFALLKSGISSAEPAQAWRALTETTAKTLRCHRVSVWLFTRGDEELVLQDLYELHANRHESGERLESAACPEYFHALRWSRAIVAPDAATDPYTREFAGDYIAAHNIVSMLDSGIWQGGRARGAVCLESVGERRYWTLDEQQFASSMADLAAAALDRDTLRRAHAQLEESRELFERAVNSSPDWISVVRLSDGTILHVNEAFERDAGYKVAEVIGKTTLDIGLWVDPVQRAQWADKVTREGLVRDFEVQFRRKPGDVRTFHLSGERIDIRGEACVVTTSRDVTERKRQESLIYAIAQGVAAETGESFFRSLVAHLGRALEADVAFVGELDPANRLKVRTIAVQAGDKPGADFEYDLHGSPCETVIGRGVCAYPSGVGQQFPLDVALTQKGIEAYVGAPLVDSRGRALGLISVLFKRPLADPATAESMLRIFAVRASGELERGHNVDSLRHLAMHDALTQLPNRIRLRETIEQGLERVASREGLGALLLVDLDRFKEINDTLGHPVGDVLLTSVARRLSTELGGTGLVARLGGDEFAIWFDRFDNEAQAEAAAARVLSVLTAPFEVGTYRLEIGASIGIALAPHHGATASGLLRCADVAMYSAKRLGAGFAVYDQEQDPYSTERLALLSELNSAVRRNELVVHYQPRVRLADGALVGFEALVRWEHPRLGLLPPGRFIPLAELSDVIRPLTLCVLGQALAQQRVWASKGTPVRMSVNLSARHLLDDACPEQVERLLKTHGADPKMLELEITESALIADPERANATVARLRALGVQLAVDDFGTGYSSLSHLKRLPLHALKIDVSFVSHMLTRREDRVIVESTIALAHNLGLSVVAEGIEDEATLAALRASGCDEGQGFHVARPMDAEAATRWIAK
ncbi:bifunctional diguanylate cyclase/phosphodiesterase [Usitatibacter palustris]|uniref:PAS domain S-box-containing protein/diguanylate cyclase (GGDEF) domain-containing protein n=1 Tax=Usitatibacter palustris TaxID=2732487 RepID=A0A6M4H6S9_9PROT|nr:EAL domain-containing protein [Usitatibacter palustris]QJR15329.1 hypothetical protein DSM104440_02148 [Usitatibacter palustris]